MIRGDLLAVATRSDFAEASVCRNRLGIAYVLKLYLEAAEIYFQMRAHRQMPLVFGQPNRKIAVRPNQRGVSEQRRFNANGLYPAHRCIHLASFHSFYRKPKNAAGVAHRHIYRCSGLKLLGAEKIDNGQHVLDWFGKVESATLRIG